MNQSTEITKSNEKWWYTLQELADGCHVTVQTARYWQQNILSWAKNNGIPFPSFPETTKFNFLGFIVPDTRYETTQFNFLGSITVTGKSRNGAPIYRYDEQAKNNFIQFLAHNQLHKARNSKVGSASVETVTKDMVQSIVKQAVEAATKPLLETISILQEDNKKLHEQLTQLLEAPKTLSLPSGQTVHPLKAILPLDSFCRYMEIPTPVLLSKKSPISGGKPIKDFPLTTVEQFLSYVSYVLEEGYSSSQRYSWLQSHPKAAKRLGYL